MEPISGLLLGGIARLAPEVLNWFDKKDERAHELALIDKNLAADKQRAEFALAQSRVDGDNQQTLQQFTAMIEATKAQGQMTGVKFIDALNQTVRPVITYWLFALYALAKVAVFVALYHQSGSLLEAARISWDADDRNMLAGILGFWFVNRVYAKRSN